MSRARFLPILPTLAAGVFLCVFGTSRTELHCERATHACTWHDGVLGGEDFAFQIAEVREVRMDGDHGKHGNDGQVEILVGNHDPLVFGQGERESAAQRMTEQTRAFFTGGTGARLDFATPSRTWMFFLGGGFLLGALAMLINARRPEKGSLLVPVAMFVAVLAVGGSVTTCVRRDDPGLVVSG